MFNDCKCLVVPSNGNFLEAHRIRIEKHVHYKKDKNQNRSFEFYFRTTNYDDWDNSVMCQLNYFTIEEVKFKSSGRGEYKEVLKQYQGNFNDITADLFCFKCEELFLTVDQFNDFKYLSSLNFKAIENYIFRLSNNKENLNAMQLYSQRLANSNDEED